MLFDFTIIGFGVIDKLFHGIKKTLLKKDQKIEKIKIAIIEKI